MKNKQTKTITRVFSPLPKVSQRLAAFTWISKQPSQRMLASREPKDPWSNEDLYNKSSNYGLNDNSL